MEQHPRCRSIRRSPSGLGRTQEAIVTLLYAAADMMGSHDPEERRRAATLLAAVRLAEEACRPGGPATVSRAFAAVSRARCSMMGPNSA
jgi:hypothetical protein